MTGIIVQARLTSTRLPGKIKHLIYGIPVLEHCINRCHASKLADMVVIASPHSPECCLNEEIFIGSETDVLDRYYKCAKKYGFKYIVRITSDCPLISPYEIDRGIKTLIDCGYDYVTNIPGAIDGWDVEAMTFLALENAWLNAKDPYDREHVTPYIKKSDEFKKFTVAPIKLSIDNIDDLKRVEEWHGLERKEYSNYRWNGELCDPLHQTSFNETSA